VFKMSEEWRLLQTGASTAAKNMAIDRAVLVANSRGLVPPTVRFYEWIPSAISIGYFQSLEEEVDLQMCEKYKVDYVRRITGGGAVFHEDELTYSIVIPESHPLIPKNIMKSYHNICGAIIKGLSELGINSDYMPINDIICNGKKISGNAQTRKEKTVLQHGTVLTDVNVDKMFSVLKVPNEKIKDKMISDVKQRVTSIRQILGKKANFDEIAAAMKTGFEKQFGIKLVEGALLKEEKKLTDKYEKECFLSKEWNHKR
jgi:lipoate-protein ligase A